VEVSTDERQVYQGRQAVIEITTRWYDVAKFPVYPYPVGVYRGDQLAAIAKS